MGRRSYWRTLTALALTGALFVSVAHAAGMPKVAKLASQPEDAPSKIIQYYYIDGEYVNGSETHFTYDDYGNVAEEVTLYNVEGEMVNSTRVTYENGGPGVLNSMEYQWFEGAWVEYTRNHYSYLVPMGDVNAAVLLSVTSEMTDGSIWVPIYKLDYSYPDASTVTSVWSMHDGSDWYPVSQYTTTLNENGDPTLVLSGDYFEDVYTENSREVYEYNANGNLTIATIYGRTSSTDPWVSSMINTYSYDEQGKMTEMFMSMRNWETEVMEQTHWTTFAYDDQDRMTEEVMYYRELEADPWEPGGKTVYDYGDGTAVEIAAAPDVFTLFRNSPNPFNPATTITFSLAVTGHVTLDVYSTTGQKVATLVDGTMDAGHHQAVWDARGFATGTYITRLTVDGIAQTGKMLLVK